MLLLILLAAISVEKGPVPEGLAIEGKVVAHARFKDSTGSHVVVVTETDEVRRGEGRNKKLFGYQFDADKGGKWKQLWKTQDFVNDCEFDLTLEYAAGSLEVSDLDSDGIAETRFAYSLTCRSDVSPLTVKVLLHEGSKKFAVRGESREDVGNGEFAGGTFTADKELPKPFLEPAVTTFKKAAKVP